MSDDFRWLIEAPGAKYLAARQFQKHADLHWTSSHDDALAFRSKFQAESLMLAVRTMKPDLFGFEVTLGNAKPIEHGWMNTTNPVEEPVRSGPPRPSRPSPGFTPVA